MKLHVATRKGLFTYQKASSGWRITQTAFLGDPVTQIMTDPRNGDHYAALNLGHFGVKLWRSDKGTEPFKEIGVPKYPAVPEGEEGASLKIIWALAAAGRDAPDTIWAGTIPGGLFRSNDRGDNWTLMTSLWECEEKAHWFGGGYDDPGIHSVLIDPSDSSKFLVGISCGGVWRTHDNGTSFELLGDGLRAAYMPPEQLADPRIQDPHLIVANPSKPEVIWMQHHNGIFRSIDTGQSWTELQAKPSTFGFAVATHPTQPDTAWFVPGVKDECRIPVDGKLIVNRTRDGGKTFENLSKGLPQEHAYDIVLRHALDVHHSGNTLAFGTTTGNLYVSDDEGDSWSLINGNLPPVYALAFDPLC